MTDQLPVSTERYVRAGGMVWGKVYTPDSPFRQGNSVFVSVPFSVH